MCHAMSATKFVAYYRVSTAKQGRSGLGLDAQRETVRQHLATGGWPPIAEFTEIESGKRNSRPEMAKALLHCQLTGATLIIAKLDRLARKVSFLAKLDESKVEFIACDMPFANRFNITVMMAFAENEAKMISDRTIAALEAAKKRGTVLGGYKGGPVPDSALAAEAKRGAADAFADRLAPMLQDMRSRGMSLHAMAAELTQKGIRTPQDGNWKATTVRRVLLRAAA